MDHPIKISCSEDTEGHAGEDNREYLLQLSRTFPLDISAGTTHPDDRQFQRLRPVCYLPFPFLAFFLFNMFIYFSHL